MSHPSEATYFRQRARSLRAAALDTTDICARSANGRMAIAYEIRSQEAEAGSDDEEHQARADLTETGLGLAR